MRKKHRESERRLILVLLISAMVVTGTLILAALQSTSVAKQQGKRSEVKTLRIDTPNPCDTGGIVIYTNDGGVYAFVGEFEIQNDGKNGKEIEITMNGYMEASYPHGEPEIKEQYGP